MAEEASRVNLVTKYLGKVVKKDCPHECGCKLRGKEEIALVPPSEEIIGVVISRDPTTGWWRFYRCLSSAELEFQPDNRRRMLFASAIPGSLIMRALAFGGEQISREDTKHLVHTIFEKTYWTHLHKCFTDSSEKEAPSFKAKNAQICADQWLGRELDLALSGKARYVVALGNNVQSWVRDWKKRTGSGVEIINLIHPSGQNNAIWSRSPNDRYKKKIEETEEVIKRLVWLCKEH